MKKQIAYLLFLFSALFVSGQVTLAVSGVKDPKVNQSFNLTVLLEISGENMVQETPLRMPDLSKFEIVGSASDQNTVILDEKKRNILNQMVYQWILTPKEAGKFKFGSALVTVNGKIYKTEPFDITVRDPGNKSTLSDNVGSEIYLNLEVSDKTVFKNEPTLAVLRAYSRDYGNFRKLNNIKYSQQKNLNIEQVSATKSEIETHSGMSSQVIGTYIVFPSESGKIAIKPASATVQNFNRNKKISSNGINLNVKKLPAGMPVSYKNAVGNFKVNLNYADLDVPQELEKPIHIKVQVAGTGNLNSLYVPQLSKSENYLFFPPKISSVINTKKEGMSGVITAEYIVVPKKSGAFPLLLESFSFFDPAAQQYVDLGQKSLDFKIKTHDEILDDKNALEKVNDYTNSVLETVNTPILPTDNLRIKSKSSINWQNIAGNLSLVLILLPVVFFVKRKVKKRHKLNSAHYQTVNPVNEAEAEIRKEWSHQWEDHITYLYQLSNKKEFLKFFAAYDDLNLETKNHFGTPIESEFKRFLEKEKGTQIAEEYIKLTEQIQIEKYAPFQSADHIEDLVQSIETLYSTINK
jgi:hypothetical protein